MMFRATYFCFLIMFCSAGWAQEMSKSDKKKARDFAEEAQALFDLDDYYNSLQVYRKALNYNPLNENAGVNSAICIFQLAYPVDSLFRLEENLTLSKQHDATFYLALIKHRERKFDEAILLLQTYYKVKPGKRLHSDSEVRYRIRQNQNAKNFAQSPGEAFIRNMGPNLNSPYPDYVPVPNLDESVVYFTSKRKGGTNQELNTDMHYFEDIYFSTHEQGLWQMAKNAGPPLNSNTNDACVALSPDGQRMILYRTSENLSSGDLYISRIGKNGQWQEPEKLPEVINSPFIESSACFSQDTSELFFSSNRTGGFGGKDIYRIRKLPNQKWSEAFNLGPEINTSYDEDAPYLHPDGVTFYFSSKGHNSVGGYDVFSSVYDPESSICREVNNLGPPINDILDDIFFVLNADGTKAYYSSERSDSYGSTDLYEIDTRFKPKELFVLTGTAMSDSLPVKARISLHENKPGAQLQGLYSSHAASGNFVLAINPYRCYKLLAEAEDYEDIELLLDAVVTRENVKPIELKFKKKNAQ